MKNRLSSCEVLGITVNTELNDDVYGMLNSLTEESLAHTDFISGLLLYDNESDRAGKNAECKNTGNY